MMKRAWPVALLVAMAMASSAAAAVYATTGIVLKVDLAHRSLVVSGDAIPGYMEAMVMPYSVLNAKELQGIAPGASIDFHLVVDAKSSHVENIRLRKLENVEQDPFSAQRLKMIADLAGRPEAKELKRGDRVPDFSLIDQNLRQATLAQFRGKVVAVTFIYTSCALPEFCYRLSTNFSRLQKRFATRMGTDLILLTITFDPVHDTPQVMSQYAKTWNADPKGWRLLSGPKADVDKVCNDFGISFWPDEGLMTHSLHTFLIDRNGVVAANLEGNKFSASQLGDLVESVLGPARPRTSK